MGLRVQVPCPPLVRCRRILFCFLLALCLEISQADAELFLAHPGRHRGQDDYHDLW